MDEKTFSEKAKEIGLNDATIKDILEEVKELKNMCVPCNLADYLIEPVISD